MAYNNYSLEKKKCDHCWMRRDRPELYKKMIDGGK